METDEDMQLLFAVLAPDADMKVVLSSVSSVYARYAQLYADASGAAESAKEAYERAKAKAFVATRATQPLSSVGRMTDNVLSNVAQTSGNVETAHNQLVEANKVALRLKHTLEALKMQSFMVKALAEDRRAEAKNMM